jgi:hypothetical protein
MRRKRYPGTIQRRGDSFRIHLCVGGVRHSATVRTSDRKAAERLARDLERDLERKRERRAAGLAAGVRCSELFDLFERQELPALALGTADAYRDSLKPIRSYFVGELGDPLAGRIPELANEVRADRRGARDGLSRLAPCAQAGCRGQASREGAEARRS